MFCMKKLLLSTLFIGLCFGAEAKALYTCQFGEGYNQQSISNYTSTWEVKVGDNLWEVQNFNNNKNGWNVIKCGRKSDASVASIATKFAIPEEIYTVVANIDAFTKADKVNSIKLETSTTADFAEIAGTVSVPTEDFKAGDMTFTLDSPAKNLYYRITFDCAATGANGNIAVVKVTYNDNTPDDTPKPEAANIAAFLELKSTDAVVVKGDVTAYYVNGKSLYIEDESGKMCVYNAAEDWEYKQGDVIPGGFKGVYELRNGMAQMKNPADFAPSTSTVEVSPVLATLADVTADKVYDYITIAGLSVTGENRNFKISKDGTEVAAYNQFYLTMPEDLTGTFTVTGIVGVFNTTPQLLMTELVKDENSGIESVVAADENAPVEYYNLQGVRVANPTAGLYIVKQGNKVSKAIIR